MPNDKQKQRQQQELKRATERSLRGEGAVYALKFLADAFRGMHTEAFCGGSPPEVQSNIVALTMALHDKAEKDLKDAQDALGAVLADSFKDVASALAHLTRPQDSTGVVGSEELAKRIDENARS